MRGFLRRLLGARGSGGRVLSRALRGSAYVLMVGALVVLNYYTLVTRKQDYMLVEQERLLRIGGAIGASVQNVLALTEFAMIGVTAHAATGNANAQKVRDLLETVTRALPFIRTIRIVGPHGTLLDSPTGEPMHRVDLGDQDYVAYYINGGRDPFYVSGLHRDSVDGVWEISVSRPIFDFDGTLTGLRIFALNIDYLRREMLSNSHSANSEFAAARPGEYAVTLVDRTMRVVARSPWTDTDVGISMTKSEIIRGLIASQADRFAASFRNVLTGNETIGAVQWLAGRRFAIVTTGPASEVLKPWRKEALGIVTLSFIVFAGMALVGVQTARNERRQAKDAARLAAANAELLAQTKRAEASTIAKGNFLANMSHEIRTPLTGIIGYSGLALEDRALSGETRHYMTLVHSASTNLRKIIDDILDLGKIESGKIDVASSPFSLRDAVDTCVALAEPVAAVKGLELRKRFDPAIPQWLTGDGARTQQVMLNLVNNAIKFTEKGHVELAARLDDMADGKAMVCVSVRDSGIGIAADKVPFLFQRFQQADETIARRFGGTGLGLAISRALVTAMQGEIGVESTPGEGSTFWFTLTLPVAADPPPEPIEPAAEAAGRALKILVVDDSAMNADLAQALLARLGHDADIAADGGEAVHACTGARYDIVFMDVQMPGMDGMEATRRIRALDAHNENVAIVAMTANVMPVQIAEYRAAGMNDHLGKPIDRERLRAILAHMVRSGAAAAAPA